MYPGLSAEGACPLRETIRTSVMPGKGWPTQRPSESAERNRLKPRATIGPTSLWPYSCPNSGRRRCEAASSVRTVRG
ncbi:Uncharacterised protein [Mycobacteroides abscessus subsp. abscessus]|nr:Uncharacterised protein [Mycobacteroides abscessus subsp. abscessus]